MKSLEDLLETTKDIGLHELVTHSLGAGQLHNQLREQQHTE